MLLPDLEEVDEVTHIARRLVAAVGMPCVIEGQEFRIGCSLGISLYPDDATTPESLVHNADVAMYRAKQEGRNGYRLYRNEMNLQDDRQRALEKALREAFVTGEGLQLHYQPIFEQESDRLHGAEALLRWHHPLLGSVPPISVVALAERAGLLPQLDECVLERICAQLAAWEAVGIGAVPISINLSARQFWQPDLPVRVATKLKQHNLPPGLLGFEIAERTLLDKPHQAAVVLKRLRRLGGEVAINDFGTGYASFGYLQELPISMLKIDRRFVQRLDSGQRGSAAIVAAVAGLAREMELRLAAVGVETKTQREILGRHGVELIQGHLTGRAVPADHFASLYLDSRSGVTAQEA